MFFLPQLKGPLHTKELSRIISLQQRDGEKLGSVIADLLTNRLKKPEGKQKLWPLQALALAEAAEYGGVFVALPVGRGKTLVSYLLPVVMQSKIAMLLIPGSLRDKTFHDFYFLSKHWRGHGRYIIATYEQISNNPEYLHQMRPDLIVADEAHKLKNTNAGCTKRVLRYWESTGNTNFVPLSGTLATRSFYDFWHLQLMSLPQKYWILPIDRKETELWAGALDVKPRQSVGLGALSVFGNTVEEARSGYGAHIKNVPGVIMSDTTDIDCSLIISVDSVDDQEVKKAYGGIISKWELPNGHLLCTGTEIWRHIREVSTGFYYIWKYPPPDDWVILRRRYGMFIREKLRYSRKYETPSQIDTAYSDQPEIYEWKHIEKTFIPETTPIWFTNSVIEYALSLLKENSLLWFFHRAIGEKLAEYGIPTYINNGNEINTGRSIYDQQKGPSAVSVHALSEGFNLQRYNHNIVFGFPGNGRVAEQMLGRTHRNGQEAEEVFVNIICSVPENEGDLKQAIRDAYYTKATTQQNQKLTIADYIGGDTEERLKNGQF